MTQIIATLASTLNFAATFSATPVSGSNYDFFSRSRNCVGQVAEQLEVIGT